MKGHSLKIQVFEEMLQECSGSPVLGLRAFTATVQSLVEEQRSCKRGQKKKKSATIFFFFNGTLHEFACHPCAEAMLIFSVSFQF